MFDGIGRGRGGGGCGDDGWADRLDAGLPRAYTPELYHLKCAAVFEHVFESYPERDIGV